MERKKLIHEEQLDHDHQTQEDKTDEVDLMGSSKQSLASKLPISKGLTFFQSIRRFPPTIYFIISSEFCERFAYYGMRAILTFYFVYQLRMTENNATALYHFFIFFTYFMPLFGAMIADSYFGKFKVILSLSFVYAVGMAFVSFSAISCLFNSLLGVRIAICLIGLILVSVGTGGIKPCVSSFGGDQIKQNSEETLSVYFSIFYCAINAGSILSFIITPILRGSVKCFGEDCYAAAFGVPSILMFTSLIIICIGSPFYIKHKPTGRNLYLEILHVIAYAIYNRYKNRKNNLPKRHYLDWAEPKFDKEVIDGVKAVVKVSYMFLPLPIFWALFEQQGSRWLLQAVRMDTTIGSISIQPEQMQVINPIFILIFIFLFEIVLYPLLRACRIKVSPLRRMTVGIFLAGVAFIISGVLQIYIERANDLTLPSNQTRVKLINPSGSEYINATLSKNAQEFFDFELSPHSTSDQFIISSGEYLFSLALQNGSNISSYVNLGPSLSCTLLTVVTVYSKLNAYKPLVQCIDLDKVKPNIIEYESTFKVINAMIHSSNANSSIYIYDSNDEIIYNLTLSYLQQSEYFTKKHGKYSLSVNNGDKEEFSLETGEIYSQIIIDSSRNRNISLWSVQMTEHGISILWQIPMYLVITMGEIMFSIAGLEFAYSQAPKSLKSIMQSLWLLTDAFGNLIVFIVAQFSIFQSQVMEFFFFAGGAICISVLFGIMSVFYKYRCDTGNDYSPIATCEEPQPDEANTNTMYDDSNSISLVASNSRDKSGYKID